MNKMKNMLKLSLWVIVCVLCACTAGPDYVRPTALAPVKYREAAKEKMKELPKDAPKGWKMAAPMDDCDRGPWWTIFRDPILNELEERVAVNNENIHAAYAQFKQSISMIDFAASAYYPTVSAFASYTRQKPARSGSGVATLNSQNSLSNSAAQAAGVPNVGVGGPNNVLNPSTGGVSGGGGNVNIKPFSTYLVSLNASWEPDLWGGVRRAVEAAVDFAQSNAALIAATQLSMQGTLAQSYFQLRGLDADQKLLDETVAAYRRALQITENRYNSGVAQRLDVLQAKTQLDTAITQSVENGIVRGQLEHAIAVLIGKPPGCFALAPRPLLPTPPKIPLNLPSALLERRPDIAQMERLVAQANAKIGVAVAAYYPSVTLTGTIGFVSNNLKRLFTSPSLFWSYGAQVAQLIFDGGLRDANVCIAFGALDQAIAVYRQTVLAAFQEVEDNLVSLNHLNAEINSQKDAVVNADKTLSILWNQYKAGTAAYSDVIIAQNNLYLAKKTLNGILSRRLVSAVGLIKALGGGFDACSIYHCGHCY